MRETETLESIAMVPYLKCWSEARFWDFIKVKFELFDQFPNWFRWNYQFQITSNRLRWIPSGTKFIVHRNLSDGIPNDYNTCPMNAINHSFNGGINRSMNSIFCQNRFKYLLSVHNLCGNSWIFSNRLPHCAHSIPRSACCHTHFIPVVIRINIDISQHLTNNTKHQYSISFDFYCYCYWNWSLWLLPINLQCVQFAQAIINSNSKGDTDKYARCSVYGHETFQSKSCSGQSDLKWSCQSLCKFHIDVEANEILIKNKTKQSKMPTKDQMHC